jgi:cobalt-zinc-cadmium efflux system protein
LRWALAVTIGVAFLEFGGGVAAHSLALVTDAAHVCMDAVALGIAVAAAAQAGRPPTDRQSYGFARFEIIAALVNGMLLFGITAVIVVEAVRRFAAPELPQGNIMFAVAAAGFAINVGIGLALRRSARKDLNTRAALFHVGSDAVGALSVAVGGLVLLATGASWIDPALSLFVAAIILLGVVRIVGEAVGVLLESAPSHAAISTVRSRMVALPGVEGIHDLHVWTIGSGEHVLSAHVLLADARISEASAILRQIEQRVHDEFAIGHVTVQFECKTCAPGEEIVCTQRPDGER